MILLTVIKFACLLWGTWYTIINTGRMKYRQEIPSSNSFIQALGITGFIFLQFFI